MKSLFKIQLFTILLSVSFLVGIPLNAQVTTSIDGVDISTTPNNPNPGQKTMVRVESFVTDLNSASISWSVDGKSEARGTGLTSINVVAPALGKSTSVTAVITTAEGNSVRKTVTLRSGSVDLVWESSGYTPPLYEGKALFAYENLIKITAIPHLVSSGSTEIDPKTLVYKWTKNDKVVQDQSGYGAQTLMIQEDIPRPLEIEVEVTTRTGSQKAVGSITIQPGEPTISFYEDSPLYGVLYNRSLGERVRLSNQEITVRAIPFSFSKSPSLSYIWSVNNLEREDLSTNQSITLRTKGDTEGSSLIGLEIRNLNNILQGARREIGVVFSKRVQTNETF